MTNPTRLLPPVTGELLAEGATVAQRPAGPCSLCSKPIRASERYARLVGGGGRAHVRCIASRSPGEASCKADAGRR